MDDTCALSGSGYSRCELPTRFAADKSSSQTRYLEFDLRFELDRSNHWGEESILFAKTSTRHFPTAYSMRCLRKR